LMAYGVVILAGAGLMTPVFHLDEVVQQSRAELAPGHVRGTVYLTQCSPVVKDTGRGDWETFYRCMGEFLPESRGPGIPDVALVSDLREVPEPASVDALVVPGENRAYRPWPLGFLYLLSLIATPLFAGSLVLRLFTTRHRLAHHGLGAATLLGLAAEVAEQFWVGW
jgi:hypothetical protein